MISMADPIITIGSNGDAVKKAQKALNDRGWWLTVDKIFGSLTRNAVVGYQTQRSVGSGWEFSYPLKVDGIVGPATWSRLTPPVIKRKATGNAVRILQELLNGNGYSPGPMDGKFGPLTETAVKDFQLGWLTVDGIVGGKTWAALGS